MIDDPADLTNGDLARIFHEIGDMLELKGELVFKTVAYHRAADAIGRSPVDLVSAYRAGQAAADPGRRQGHQRQDRASSPRPATWPSTTGSAAEVPPSLVELLADPGPRAQDRPPAPRGARHRDGRRPPRRRPRRAGCASVRGMSARTEALVLEGIARLDDRFDRMLLDRAEELIDGLIDGAGADARASARSSRPARSAAGASRSATSTCSPRPTSRPR